MGRKRNSFKLNDAARAIRAAKQAGIEHPVVEIDPKTGKITIWCGQPAGDAAKASGETDRA